VRADRPRVDQDGPQPSVSYEMRRSYQVAANSPTRLPAPAAAAGVLGRGNGTKAWRTRRANELARALEVAGRKACAIDDLREAVSVISRYIAGGIGHPVAELPRGYAITQNAMGEWSIVSRSGALLTITYLDPVPVLSEVILFAHDVSTGWLREVSRALNLSEGFLEGKC
jgi:hypothetical protein